ncbi:hypothetical protein XENOCAPTIV_010437, partial [Xenoophorus captivus]
HSFVSTVTDSRPLRELIAEAKAEVTEEIEEHKEEEEEEETEAHLVLFSSFKAKKVQEGHKRAPSDVSVASSEDEKIPLSPLESVPEKSEPILPVPSPAKLPVSNHVVETISTEEPAASAAEEKTEEAPNTAVKEEPAQKPSEENIPEAVSDAALPESEPEPNTPSKELQRLQLDVEDEKEVDTAEVPEGSETSGPPQEDNSSVAEEANTPAEEEEEDRYKHLKVTLTLPEPEKEVLKEENGEQPAEKDRLNVEEEKKDLDSALKKIIQQHKHELATIERDCLNHKQQLLRAGLWCFQEMEQMQRYNQRLIEELKNKQTQERARLPKIQRSEAKTRMAMFKKSLRITGAAITPEQEREKIKQNEKCHLLIEHETQKLKELDEEHSVELKEWREKLRPRKKALEEEFARKLQEQEVFFKMSGESECLNPSTQSRISKFYPIPTVHSTGF